MKLQMLIKKNKEKLSGINHPKDVPDGLLRKCRKCKSVVLAKNVKEANYICPKCGGYFRVHAKRRIEMIGDEGTFVPWFEGMAVEDVLEFPGYVEKVEELRKKTGLDEAVTCGTVEIDGHQAAVAVMDGRFLMGSMGKIVGEKITRTVERATEESLPVIIFSCSGGARMQEGIVSLMQMAKTSAALKKHHESGNLYISVLTDPTTGGVTASFAMLGDIILAEPKALIGFAGPRVIEQTIGEKLPKGFQRAEYLLEHGFVDGIVERQNLKATLAKLLALHQGTGTIATGELAVFQNPVTVQKELTPWERVQISRKKDRPVAEDYITALFPDFMELHGDRSFGDDHAIIGGVATFHGVPVTVIAQAKGHDTRENIHRNFGMPNPEGYRKALRLMQQAEKFHRPVFCIVDTPGAFCGIEAEQRGQGEAIARNLFEMSSLKTPVVTMVIGEGGSGGALAMAVSDEVWMLENSVYSILSPEGYASILLKDGKLAAKSANMMKMTSKDLLELNVIEQIFEEPEKYTKSSMAGVVHQIEKALIDFLEKSSALTGEELAEKRYERFRNM